MRLALIRLYGDSLTFASLRQSCLYDEASLPSPALTPHTPGAERFEKSSSALDSALDVVNIRQSIVADVTNSSPHDILRRYHQEIEPWFPVLEAEHLAIPDSWSELPLDTLLFLAALNIYMHPVDESLATQQHRVKSYLSLTEVSGLNTVHSVLARIVVTLFEVAHGMYPAAYISLGSTVRAVDALHLFNEKQEDLTSIWRAVLVIDW
jgi:hypothetical protein